MMFEKKVVDLFYFLSYNKAMLIRKFRLGGIF